MKQPSVRNETTYRPPSAAKATMGAPLWDCRVKLASGTVTTLTVAAWRIKDAHKKVTADFILDGGIIQEITAHVPAYPMRNPVLDPNRLSYAGVCKLVAIMDPIARLDGPVQVAA